MIKVVGLSFTEAETKLNNEGIEVEKIEETSKTVQSGYVTKQEIEEGKNVKVGQKVKIHVSIGTGIKSVAVPYVIGDTEADAKTKLADLEVTTVYEEDMSKINGKVLKQSIDAGKTVDEGTKITITVNKIEELKTGTLKINLKALLGEEAIIEVDENGVEIEPNVDVSITVNDESVYSLSHRKDDAEISTEISGKGTVTVKVWVNETRKAMEQFDLSVENPVLTIE